MSDIYTNTAIAIDYAQPITSELSDTLFLSSEDLEITFRHWRMTTPQSICMWGPPRDEYLYPRMTVPTLTVAQSNAYKELVNIFSKLLLNCNILTLITPLGGIYIRKSVPGESPHPFLVCDLPGDPTACAWITYEK